MAKDPLFLKFINRSISTIEILTSFSKSSDSCTAEAVERALKNPPDLEPFRKELIDAVRDLIKDGLGEEFKAFVDHYMCTLEEDVLTSEGQFGQNISRSARVKDETGPWVQGFICYNLSLYIRVYGLDDLKICRVCEKIFGHKGKWAVYCSDTCKSEGKKNKR